MLVCVDLDRSLSWSWLSANKFFKIRQLIGAGRSDWHCCHKRQGSGSRRACSKRWLMAASVVYLSPFVALSLQHFAWREDSVLVLVAHVQYLTEQQVLHVLDLHYRQCALFLLPLNNEVIPTNHPKTGLVFAEHKLHCTINSLN